MEFIKLIISPYKSYIYKDASNIEMTILGHFLATDIGCTSSPFKEWGFNDNWGDACSGNITALEKDDNYILLSDLYSEEKKPTVLKMTRQQYVQVISDWEEKVCKFKPKEVLIKYENNQFIIEINN
jgi:hypothetical protein